MRVGECADTQPVGLVGCVSVALTNLIYTERTHHKYELEIVGKRPANGIAVLFVSVLARTTLDKRFTNEIVHG